MLHIENPHCSQKLYLLSYFQSIQILNQIFFFLKVNCSNYAAFILCLTFPNKVFWLLFSTLTLTIFPISSSSASKITEFKYSFLPKYSFWSLSLFSTSKSISLFSWSLLCSIWLLNKRDCNLINLSFKILLFISLNFDAVVPGLELNIKEKELINFISLTSFNVWLKSFSSSPGYPL